VRVGEFGVQEEIELWIESQFLVSHLDDASSSSLDDLTSIDWLD